MRTLKFFSVILLTVIFYSAMIADANAAFTIPPTLDLTTSSNCIGATDAVYTFHSQNPDQTETVVSFTVPIPAGYSINPTYLTTTPDIIVLTGVYGFIGQPISGYLRVNTTGTSGLFTIYAKRISPPTTPPYVPIGTATLTPPTPSTPGLWSVLLPLAPNNGEYIDLSFIAGFFINPSTPGVYTWGPSTAIPSSGPPVTMDPRTDFTNKVYIRDCSAPLVGGVVKPINKLDIFTSYIALVGLFTTIAVVAVASWKKNQN